MLRCIIGLLNKLAGFRPAPHVPKRALRPERDALVTNGAHVLSDELLEHLADRYHRYAVRYWTGVPFHKYLLYPHEFDRMASRISAYDHILAIEVREGENRLVVSTVN